MGPRVGADPWPALRVDVTTVRAAIPVASVRRREAEELADQVKELDPPPEPPAEPRASGEQRGDRLLELERLGWVHEHLEVLGAVPGPDQPEVHLDLRPLGLLVGAER